MNYSFIFELDANYKLIHHQLYSIGLILFTIWLICLTFQIAELKMSTDDVAIFTLAIIIVFFVVCFWPFHCFYLTARKQLGKTLFQIITAPFWAVRFRHFFLADVLTSMITPLKNCAIIGCYFADSENHWKKSTPVAIKTGECPAGDYVFIAMGIIPYWWRFAQCWRKVYDNP